jgi:cytochrome P450
MSIKDFDFTTWEFSQNPYRFYDALRASGTVHFIPKNNTYLVTGYQEINSILTNTQVFSSGGNNVFDPILLNCDPPEHATNRKVFNGKNAPFSLNRVNQIALENKAICSRLFDGLSNNTSFDLLRDLSLPFSSLVILKILGIETTELDELRNWSTDAVLTKAIENTDYATDIWNILLPKVEKWIDQTLSSPHKTGLAEIVFFEGGRTFDRQEIINFTRVLLLGGNETTPNLIASAFLKLVEHPEVFEEVKNDHSLIAAVVNETLRLESPTQLIKRITTEDIIISGVQIPAHSSVTLALGAANRDPEVFENPTEFNIFRPAGKIVSFGFGPHYCLGAHLSKQEAEIVLSELISRYPEVTLPANFQPVYRHSSHIRGITSMPLLLKPYQTEKLSLYKKIARKEISTKLEEYGHFPTFENYPALDSKRWIYTYPSPFIHANVCASLLKAGEFNDHYLNQAKSFLIQTKETDDLWRFWDLKQAQNNVPIDMDDTAICSYVLNKFGVTLANKKIIFSLVKQDGRLLTWLFPSLRLAILNFRVFLKSILTYSAIKPTLKSGMLAKNDTDISVMATVCFYLGNTEIASKIAKYCVKNWQQEQLAGQFYDNQLIDAFHIARAFSEGVIVFEALKPQINDLIATNYKQYDFISLLLAAIISVDFDLSFDLQCSIKRLILEHDSVEESIIQHYPYFTSKDRNFYAGSSALTAAWFLLATKDW